MHSLRFRLIVGLGATALNLLLISGGYYLFGPQCALGFGATFGIAVLAVVTKVYRKGLARRKERRYTNAAIAVGMLCGVAITVHAVEHGLHHTRSRMRDAGRLAKQLQSDAKYQLVIVSYHGPPEQNDERLSVRGYVSESHDLEPLRQMVYGDREWSVEWEVGVMSDRQQEPPVQP